MTIWYEGMPLPDRRLLPRARRRIWELDFLRGVFILLMVMDHTFFDVGYPYMFGQAWMASGNAAAIKMVEFCRWYWDNPIREWVHDVVLWGFFLLCGMSVAFSRNNYLHSLKIALCAVALTCGTILAEGWGIGEGITVRFGVLHMLAVTSFAVALVHGVVKRHRNLQIFTFFALGVVFYLINVFYLEVKDWSGTPDWWCILGNTMGNPYAFSPGDYFPIFGYMDGLLVYSRFLAVPYISRVFWGAALVPLLYPTGRSLLPRLDRAWHRPVCFVGRHTLVVVLAHQIVIPIFLALITGWFITPGDYAII